MKTLNHLLPIALVYLTGCSAVAPVEQSDTVTLVKPGHVTGCDKLKTVNFSVTHKVGIITRSDEVVTGDLVTLAKNKAIELGADTIVAQGPANEGRMTFDIYDCKG